MTGKLIWTFSDSWTESKTERDEQWLGSCSQSLFVSLRFTLRPRITECPYQLPSHCSSLSVYSWTKSKTERDEQWLGSWYGHSVTRGRRVKWRETNNDWEVDMDMFYSPSTSHWMSIATSQSLFVSLRFTLSPRVTQCPYQFPSHCSSLSVLLSETNNDWEVDMDTQWLVDGE
jgi:hypothetical protein